MSICTIFRSGANSITPRTTRYVVRQTFAFDYSGELLPNNCPARNDDFGRRIKWCFIVPTPWEDARGDR
jgi:hypothetical protein